MATVLGAGYIFKKSHCEFANKWKVGTTARPNKGVLKKWRSADLCAQRSKSWDNSELQGAEQRA